MCIRAEFPPNSGRLSGPGASASPRRGADGADRDRPGASGHRPRSGAPYGVGSGSPDSLEPRCQQRTPWPSPNIFPVPAPRAVRWWSWSTGRSTGRPVSPGSSGASTTSTPWPTTVVGTTVHASPCPSTPPSTVTSTTCWRWSTGARRWWSVTAMAETSPSGRRCAAEPTPASSRWWPTNPHAVARVVGPQPQLQRGHATAMADGADGAGTEATTPTEGAVPTDPVSAAEAAERFFRRMVGDAVLGPALRLGQGRTVGRRTGPRSRAGRHPHPPGALRRHRPGRAGHLRPR